MQRQRLRNISSMYATFSNLQKCGLWSEAEPRLDLAPLQALPSLNHLVLKGRYQNLSSLACLTRLECVLAFVCEVNELAPSLQHLEIRDGSLRDMHPHGISLCTALTQLVLSNFFLTDSNGRDYWTGQMSVVPVNIGMLTQLHTLHLSSDVVRLRSIPKAASFDQGPC